MRSAVKFSGAELTGAIGNLTIFGQDNEILFIERGTSNRKETSSVRVEQSWSPHHTNRAGLLHAKPWMSVDGPRAAVHFAHRPLGTPQVGPAVGLGSERLPTFSARERSPSL